MSRAMDPKKNDSIELMTDGELRDELIAIADYIKRISEELAIRAMQKAE